MIKYAIFISLFCLQAFVMMGAEQNSTENIKDPFIFDVDIAGHMESAQIKPVKDQDTVNPGITIDIFLYSFKRSYRYGSRQNNSIRIFINDEDDKYFCGIPLSKGFLTQNPSISDLKCPSDKHNNNPIFEEIVKPIFQGNFIVPEKDFSVKQENAYQIKEYKVLQKRIEATYYALFIKLLRTKIIEKIMLDAYSLSDDMSLQLPVMYEHIKALRHELAKISSQESIFSEEQELVFSDFLNYKLTLGQAIGVFKKDKNKDQR